MMDASAAVSVILGSSQLGTSPKRSGTPVDIPNGWDPRTNKQPTGLFVALPAAVPCFSSPTGHPTKEKIRRCKQLVKWTPIDIPNGWDPRAKQQPTGLIAYGATHRRPVLIPLDTPPKKKSAVAKQQRIFGGVPSGIRTQEITIYR